MENVLLNLPEYNPCRRDWDYVFEPAPGGQLFRDSNFKIRAAICWPVFSYPLESTINPLNNPFVE